MERPASEETLHVAGVADAADAAALVRGFHRHLGSVRPLDPQLESLVAAAIAEPTSEICLARLGGEPAGYALCRYFASVWFRGCEMFLEDFFVAEAARGVGLGQRLLAFTLARAAERGAASVLLQTNENNVRAHALYRAFGFEVDQEPRWGDGREIVFRRSIDAPRSRVS